MAPRKKVKVAVPAAKAAKEPKEAAPETAPEVVEVLPEEPKVRSGSAQVSAWLNKINKNKKFQGVAQVRRASDFSTPYYLRRPTGVMSLDVAMAGGFHAGGHAQIFGADSVGKTHLAFRTAGQVQKNYGNNANILIVSTEIRTDKGFARTSGFCVAYSEDEIKHFTGLRKERGMEPFSKEELADLRKQIGSVVVVTASSGDKALDVAVSALEEGIFQLVIIESLGALLRADQEDASVGDKVYGGSSTILTSFVNQAYPLFIMDRADGTMLETTLIGINQARANIGNTMGGTHAAAGAYAWKHGQLISVELKKGEPIYNGSARRKIGRAVRWELTKGKAGTHDGIKGEYNYFYVGQKDPVFWKDVELLGSQWGVDVITDLVETAKSLDVVTGAAWLVWEENGKELGKFHGKERMAEAIVNDYELEQRLRTSCMLKANLPVRFK
jgi:recombination protein RecA